MPELQRLHLRELRWQSHDRCIAAFESEGGETVETEFAVQLVDGITLVSDEAHVLVRFEGSADELRSINNAVAAFLDAANLRHHS
jgi:hypothetical protein